MSFAITISREYGSGGRFIARELAKKLGVAFYDNELIAQVAKETGYSMDYLKKNDEAKDSLWDGFSSAGGIADPINIYTPTQNVALATFDTIKKLADEKDCVIVGRCASYVLRDKLDVLNVFITAPIQDKVFRAITYYGIDPKKAEALIEKRTKERAQYFEFYTGKVWNSASTYDLCISATIGVENCVDVIIDYAKRKRLF